MQKPPLASQPWLPEFLAGEGFSRSQPDTFTRGKASIRLAGNELSAHPGTGEKAWTADLGDAEPETARFLVKQILSMRPFFTEAAIEKERTGRERALSALSDVAASIEDGPDTGGGVQLRRFLWSLYNNHHVINLWRMTSVLDSKHAGWVSEVFAAAVSGLINEGDLKQALVSSGEMKRWDLERPGIEALERLDEAERIVRGLANSSTPSRAHTQFAALLRQFSEVTRELWKAPQSDQSPERCP